MARTKNCSGITNRDPLDPKGSHTQWPRVSKDPPASKGRSLLGTRWGRGLEQVLWSLLLPAEPATHQAHSGKTEVKRL